MVIQNKNLFYTIIGTIIEHLDSTLFALYIPVLAAYFFDKHDQQTTWFLGFLAFSLYFIVRPLGAIILGLIGDAFGRKTALLLSITIMSLATLGLGLAPSYADYGVSATAIFLFLRILQGLSVGGEYSTAMTYVFESSAPNKKVFYGSLLLASTHLGGTIAAIFAYFNSTKFNYIFILAGIIGLISLKGRIMLSETYVPKNKNDFYIKNYFYSTELMSYLRIISACACLVFVFYTINFYFNKIIQQKFNVDMQTIFSISLLLHIILVLVTPLVGYILDQYKLDTLKIMRMGVLTNIFIGVPVLILVQPSNSLVLFILAEVIITISHILFCAPIPKTICSYFHNNVRNTHVCLSYSLGVSITAASMPFINDFAYGQMGIHGIAIMLLVFMFLGYLSTLDLKSKNI